MVTTWCGINTYKGGDTQSSSCETIKGWGENHQRAYIGFRWGFGRMTAEFCPVDWHTKWAWFGKKKKSEAAYFAVKGELTIVNYGQILLLEERHGLDVVDAVYWLYWQVSWNGHWLKIFDCVLTVPPFLPFLKTKVLLLLWFILTLLLLGQTY